MNEEAVKKLRFILSKDKNDLTSADRAFIRARREYLSKDEAEEYKGIIKGKEQKTKTVELPLVEEILKGRKLEDVPMSSIWKICGKLEIPKRGLKREALNVAIRTKLGPEVEQKPE